MMRLGSSGAFFFLVVWIYMEGQLASYSQLAKNLLYLR
ncbi:hypothetical protein GBL_2921 [Geobacillus kaustophilus GBlys]|uniref:Uncharacterized protein n=1 Tax=Geobacillus kaustophilus GBlys TaxID=1337888 RepID=U2Y5T3_GEOKU|nr:hypothetical protein GBL_2921 [Geobacillus kaustophilus GBlys]GAJ60087.1 hypothetical protein B23_3313 [Geobacillus thermoleovorans B23]